MPELKAEKGRIIGFNMDGDPKNPTHVEYKIGYRGHDYIFRFGIEKYEAAFDLFRFSDNSAITVGVKPEGGLAALRQGSRAWVYGEVSRDS